MCCHCSFKDLSRWFILIILHVTADALCAPAKKIKQCEMILYSDMFSPKDRMLISAVILASASSSSCVSGRSR